MTTEKVGEAKIHVLQREMLIERQWMSQNPGRSKTCETREFRGSTGRGWGTEKRLEENLHWPSVLLQSFI